MLGPTQPLAGVVLATLTCGRAVAGMLSGAA